jgi:long-subunit fatty acid transport protein
MLLALRHRGIRVAGLLLGLARSGQADPVHHNEVLVGGRALGMAGAATGLAEDAASVYYNPAGIAQMKGASFSASFQVNAFQKITVDGGLQAAGLADLVHDEQPSLAVYVSAIAKVGKEDANGFRRHALAFSTVNPDQQQLSFGGVVRLNDNFANLSIDSKDNTVWRGLSYAYSLSPRWALGLSAFWSHRELAHREALILAAGVQPRDYIDSQGNTQNAVLADNLRGDLRTVQLTSDAAVVRLGVRHDLTEHWRLGLMLQPPGVPFSTKATVRQERLTFGVDEPDAPLPTFFDSTQPAPASSPIPWEVRLGGAYLYEDWTVGLDVSLHGPSGSASDPVVAVGTPSVDTYFGRAPALPFLLPATYYTDFVANVALGVEGVIAEVVPWATGVFTDLSAAPSINGPSNVYAWPDVDRFGVTGSLGWRAKGYNLQVGGALVLGAGDALVVDTEPGGSVYTPSRWRERTFTFFISGYQRAAEDLAKSAVKTVLE